VSVANSIFSRDLTRQARSDDSPKLVGRHITDPNSLAEANYFLAHGMTRAQAAERQAARRREEAEAQTLSDLNGEPPRIVNTKGLGEKRAALANYFDWLHGEAKRRDDLLQRRAELDATIAAPAETESKIHDAVRKTAAAMMGRVHASETIDRGALDAQLSSERHQSEAAKIAITEIDRQIEKAELRVARLTERESEFLHPALVEAADEIGVGKLYVKKIAELRAVTDLIFGLANTVGGYGSGFEYPADIKFPKATALPSLSKAASGDYFIGAAGNIGVWKALALALRFNPRQDASKFVAVPK